MPRPLLLVLLLACGILAGCADDESRAVGGEEQSRQTEGQSEAIYIPLAGLKYQVQISRVLNPFSSEDAAYLAGVRGDPTALEQGRVWFGVFMRVENDSAEAHTSTGEFELVDTQDEHYQPEELPTELNPFAYAPAELQPGELLPSRGSPAGDGTINGALILFQIDAQSLQNRPVQLVFGGDVGEPGTIDLDI